MHGSVTMKSKTREQKGLYSGPMIPFSALEKVCSVSKRRNENVANDVKLYLGDSNILEVEART